LLRLSVAALLVSGLVAAEPEVVRAVVVAGMPQNTLLSLQALHILMQLALVALEGLLLQPVATQHLLLAQQQ